MKIRLFDDDDMRQFEQVFARAIVIAVKQLKHEGVLEWQPTTTPVEERPYTTRPVTPRTETPASFPPPHTPVPEPPAIEPAVSVPPSPPAPEPERERQRAAPTPLSKVIRTTNERPAGYITTDKAIELMSGNQEASKSSLSTWIRTQQIPAVICSSVKPPSKGLPGRVMVDRNALIEREKVRASMRDPIDRIRIARAKHKAQREQHSAVH